MAREPKYQVFQDRDGDWRWRLRAGNGKIVSIGGEPFPTKQHAERAISDMESAVDAVGAIEQISTAAAEQAVESEPD